MCNGNEIDVQRVIREKLDERGISLKVVAAKSELPYSNICGYFPGNERGSTPKQSVELPVSALRRLCGALPNDLLNLLVPDGFAIVEVPAGIDYDDFSARCRFLRQWSAKRRLDKLVRKQREELERRRYGQRRQASKLGWQRRKASA
jgi:hypothetical protein